MTKTWPFRAFFLYLTLGTPLAASCARESSTLGDGSGGGITGTGGKTGLPTAGTFSKSGTTSSAFGGTTSTAGKPGTGGVAGGGGTAGAGVPSDVLERAAAVVYYETTHTTASDKIIQMKLFIENKSADALPMANVKIRYWLTAEAATTLHQYFTGSQAQLPQAAFVDDGADSHVLMTFGGGSIVKGGDKNQSEIQLEISSTTTPFDQSNDFSWQPSSTTSQANDKITLYLSDRLIWGCEPSGKCFDDEGGGVGGQSAGGQSAGGQGPGGDDAGGQSAGGKSAGGQSASGQGGAQ
jgi:cellulose 1,4-beta-cellobiosidase